MNASHGEPPSEHVAAPGARDAANPSAHPARPSPSAQPPQPPRPAGAAQPAGAAHSAQSPPPFGSAQPGAAAAPPLYRADEAFAPGGGLHWSPISGRHTLHRLLSAALWAIPLGALGGFLVWRNGGGALGVAIWAVAVVLGVGLAGIVAELDRRSYGYVERDDDLIVMHGVFVRRLIVVPYGRMQFVDVTAGLLERWMRIATVRMHTAAAATDATVPGLPGTEAALLRDRLAQKGEARSMGL